MQHGHCRDVLDQYDQSVCLGRYHDDFDWRRIRGGLSSPPRSVTSSMWILRITNADVNGDGRPDLIAAYLVLDPAQPGPCIGVLLGRRSGGFQSSRDFGPHGVVCVAVQTADLNRDGKLDVVGMGDRVYVLLNDGP